MPAKQPFQVTNKRPRVTNTPRKQYPTVVDKNAMNPVTYLRTLLKTSSAHQQANQASYDVVFTKPDEKEIASYDFEVVDAIRNQNVEKLRSFHKDGKSMNACNKFGESLLHMCCRRSDTVLVKFLVNEIGVRINIKDDYGRTPCHDAFWTPNPNFDLIDVLLKAGDVHMLLSTDVRGHTPLDYARKEHWGAWIKFFTDRKELLLQQPNVKVESWAWWTDSI